MKKELFFFLGTEAELIKVFPVILECQKEFSVHVIASGQNNLKNSRILKEFREISIDLELSQEKNIKKSAMGLLKWYMEVQRFAAARIKDYYKDTVLKNKYLLVHGDTVSTMMGASVGQKLGMRVCHVEAGLRSHNLLNPFPEEIDRLLTSKKAVVHFAPGILQCKNLENALGTVINTQFNTILDSLRYSLDIPYKGGVMEFTGPKKYFVFVMHRQENLMNKKFLAGAIKKIIGLSRDMHCVIILHITTRIALEEIGMFEKLSANKHISLVPRMDYFDFMKLLAGSEYVITDGGSNQEELHYMGKPCLIMRKKTERNEGIGENAIMYNGNLDIIEKFASSYTRYQRGQVCTNTSPSKIICDFLVANEEVG